MERTKQIHWQDPIAAAEQARQMPGLAFLQAISAGTIPYPPILEALDFKAVSIEEGLAEFSFTPAEFHYNTIGSVHGGVISAILDSAMGCAVHTLLPAGTGYTTLELKVNFLKAVTLRSGVLRALGRVIHSGNRTALAEAQLLGGDGTLFAHATSTCLILRGTGGPAIT